MVREISVWELLAWCYDEQATRHMIAGQQSDRLGWGRISMTQKAIGTARQGCIVEPNNCRVGLKIHDDCLLIDDIISGLPERYPDHKEQVHSLMNDLIMAAENDVVPPWKMNRIPAKVEPVWKNESKTKPVMVHDFHGRGIACRVRCSGHACDDDFQSDLKEVRENYSRFVLGLKFVLRSLEQENLKGFKLHGLGVPETPWISESKKIKQVA